MGGNKLKNLGEILLAGSLFAGGILASEKTGLTNAFVEYNNAVVHLYHGLHKKFPLFVWSDYGNPNKETEKEKKSRFTKYRIFTNMEVGLVTSFLLPLACGSLAYRRKEREFE